MCESNTAQPVAPPTAKAPCACCGCRTLSEAGGGTYEICPVCYWEDDASQAKDPDDDCGANAVSLNAARANYAAYGASTETAKKHVRPPTEAEGAA